MKNVNKLLMMATITLLLIMGTSIIPMQSYAESGSNDQHKKNDDNKSKTSASSQTTKREEASTWTKTMCVIGEMKTAHKPMEAHR